MVSKKKEERTILIKVQVLLQDVRCMIEEERKEGNKETDGRLNTPMPKLVNTELD